MRADPGYGCDVTQHEEQPDVRHGAYLDGVGAPLADSLVDLARLAQESPNPMLRIDASGEITYANPTARDLLSVDGDWARQLVRYAAEAMQSGKSAKCECVAKERSFVFAVCPSAGGRGANVYGVDHSVQRHALEALKRSEQQYRELFTRMTEGFALHELICDQEGRPYDYRFLDVNDAFTQLTHLSREAAVGHTARQLLPGLEPSWLQVYAGVAQSGQPAHFEDFNKDIGQWFEVFAYSPKPGQFATFFRVITDRKQAQRELQEANEQLEQRVAERTRTLEETVARLNEAQKRQDLVSRLLTLFARQPRRSEYLRGVIEILKEWSGLRCLGIRVLDSARNIPYEAYVGYSQAFWESEGTLNLDVDQCLCTRCAQGKLLACERPVTTPGGSFCINDAAAFVASLTPQERPQFRGRCMVEGYSTVGAIRIRDGQTTLGILHLADERPNMLSPQTMEQLESMMPLVGGAIARLNQDQALHEQASLLELAHDAILVRSLAGQILYWNRGAELTYGYSRQQALGAECHQLLATRFPLPLEDILRHLTDAPWEGELLQRTGDGKTICVFSRWVVQRDESGQARAILEISRDVTARKQSEQELALHRQHLEDLVESRTSALAAANAALQTQAHDLARSNKDLEQFAYVASHDLQEPLRMVTSFMALLKTRYGEQLSADALQYVDFAVDGSLRMKELIDGLLAYSRIGTHGGGLESVDLNAVVERAKHNLRQSIADAGAQVTHETLPTIHGDPLQMLQLFQNLIGNAIKFRRADCPPEVAITVEGQVREWVIRVRDNGIGIDPKYAPRIFTIFKRLHTREEFPGNGIGLAICKRIVDRHHGRIWLESTPGEGTTFLLALPRMTQIAGDQ